jgi:hypothetical protein
MDGSMENPLTYARTLCLAIARAMVRSMCARDGRERERVCVVVRPRALGVRWVDVGASGGD